MHVHWTIDLAGREEEMFTCNLLLPPAPTASRLRPAPASCFCLPLLKLFTLF